MIHVSKRSEYGLFFLIALAKGQGIIPLKSVAAEYDLPYRFLCQVATDMKKAGIVGSREGVKGGYFLQMPPQEITLDKVVTTMDEPLALVSCQRGIICDRHDNCPIKPTLDSVQEEMRSVLNKYTVADFIGSEIFHYKVQSV